MTDTDKLADRLYRWANRQPGALAAELRDAAAELRRLRDRDAALTRLLDAVGDVDNLHWLADTFDLPILRRIAAAVEGIDQAELSGDDWAWAEEHRGGDL